MSSPVPQIGPRLDIGSDFVSIDSLIIQNSNLAAILLDVAPEERISKLIEIVGYGAETYQLFSTTAAAEALKAVAIGIANDMSEKKNEIVTGVNQIAQQLSAETGALSIKALLESWRTGFSELLNANFDINNTQSILAKFDAMIKEKAQTQNSEVINRLSFDVEGSAINQLQNNLRTHVSGEFEKLKEELTSIKTAMQIGEAVADAESLQANRGNIFEEDIYEYVEGFARELGDIADNPGSTNTPGIDGNNEGDITVELNRQVASGKKLLFVIECKLRKNRLSDNALLKEIDKGISNRGAKIGLIITEMGEGKDLDPFDFFHEHGHRAIVDMDPIEPDPFALRFAYLWARWQCIKDEANVLDSNVVMESLKTIKLAIANVTTIKANNTKAIGLMTANSTLADTINSQISDEIKSLENLISSLELGAE